MTETVKGTEAEQDSTRRGFSSLQKSLFGILAVFFAIHPVFWYLETHAGVPQPVASTIMVVVVVGCFAAALAMPWLRVGVEKGSLWTYMWAPILLGGDARYLNGDPLIICMEWIALFVGIFEAYALFQFFRNRRRFTSNQLSLIMAGMIVEVTLPAVYFGTEIANNLESMSSPVEMWVKFVLINVLWCTMPLLTYFWGVRRLVSQDLHVKF